jgi:gliding motility-associated-like protein
MKRLLLILCVFVISTGIGKAQFTFQNPSFEGVSQAHVVPAPWTMCFNGGTPDTQPGQWGINDPATNGNTYVSFLLAGDGASYHEGCSQQLSGCMTAGEPYTFTMDIAFSPVYNTAEPVDCYGSIAIWGGNGTCGQGEMLWSSGMITTGGWNNVTVTFTPTQNWCYVSFAPYFISACSGYINGMIDNISPIVPANPGLQITSPTANANMSCDFLVTGTTDSLPNSVTLYGNFTGSPVSANILNAANWQTFVSYPDNLSGPQTIIAVGQFPNNITKSDTVTFNLIDIEPDFTADTVCSGNPTHFTDASTITNPGTIANYAWTFEPGQTSGLQNPTYTFANPGIYNVSLIVTSNAGCSDTIVKQVLVSPGANANFVLNAGCLGTPATFQDLSSAPGGVITSWAWNFGDNSGTSVQQNPAYNYNAGGTYTVELIVQSNNGCADTTTQTVTIDPIPTADFSGSPVTGCVSLPVTFNDLSTGAITGWWWNFGDSNTSTLQNPSHIYDVAGAYDVTLIVATGSNCRDTLTRVAYITANPQVTADFIVSPGVTDEFQRTITMTDQSTGSPTIWTWDLGNGFGGNVQNPTVTYQDTGTFVIMLVANNQYNCPDTAYGTVRINPVSTFYVPNAFSPNGDGINDQFGGYGTNIKEYELMIFNRWGNRIYTTDSMLDPWDGRYKSDGQVMIDTYIYQIRTLNVMNEEKIYRGTVTIAK